MQRNKRTPNVNIIVIAITEQPTDEAHIVKNPAAVTLSRLGGLKSGRVRAKRLTSARRVEITKKAALAKGGGSNPYGCGVIAKIVIIPLDGP